MPKIKRDFKKKGLYEETVKPLRELARSEPLAERARLMLTGAADAPNGIRLVFVKIENDFATLEVHFYNLNYLDQIIAEFTADNQSAKRIFPISGGMRLRAGNAEGQIRVDSIAMSNLNEPILKLSVRPIGDYSTYTLGLHSSAIDATNPPRFDPIFAEINFKFRPGCFNANCAPEWETAPEPFREPKIDYLAKDYESFRLTMIAAMMERVPGWEATSEADFDHVLLELFSAAADELSDYQDRVMNEAYFASSRKRISLARHARLMDYHIHQGNQASTWLALEIEPLVVDQKEFQLVEGLKVWLGESKFDKTGVKKEAENSIVFLSRHKELQTVHQFLNRIGLYTWSDSIPALKAGSTSADLMLYNQLNLDGTLSEEIDHNDSTDAETVRDLINTGNIKYLLIEERLNPVTGGFAGRNPMKRQLLRLKNAEALFDPVNEKWIVRVSWEKRDALRHDYCFTVDCKDKKVENVSLFHGNLIKVFHGRKAETTFKKKGEELSKSPKPPLELFYEKTSWGTICRLPEIALAYQKTLSGGDNPPFSTLKIKIDGNVWDEVPSLIHSDNLDETGDHFVVETDENRRSVIRFGNGINGKKLPDNSEVICEYQYGEPLEGNIGSDMLVNFDVKTVTPILLQIGKCWNPFDVIDGKDREPMAEIIRRVPEAYRSRQLRAVTLADYVARAEKIEGVSRAAARYAWTGSWRTVRVSIDPFGTIELSEELRRRVSLELEAVRLIGEDIEIRPPKFVPLEIEVKLCAAPDFWIEDIKFVLEQEFSASWLPDGRRGFFHPDLWTFGQPLFESQIIGRALLVQGVEHIVSVFIKRFNEKTAGTKIFTALRHNEIIEVLNNPDNLERGFIKFEVKGGRQ